MVRENCKLKEISAEAEPIMTVVKEKRDIMALVENLVTLNTATSKEYY